MNLQDRLHRQHRARQEESLQERLHRETTNLARRLGEEDKHNPFKRSRTIGPHIRGRENTKTGEWDCEKAGKYLQICRNSETGEEIRVKVDKEWKKKYNKAYRAAGGSPFADDVEPGPEPELSEDLPRSWRPLQRRDQAGTDRGVIRRLLQGRWERSG